MNLFILKLCLLSLIFTRSECYKILVIYALPVRSVNILGSGIVKHLLNAGHEVTYIAAFPLKNHINNLKQIDVSSNLKIIEAMDIISISSVMDRGVEQSDVKAMQELGVTVVEETFKHRDVQAFLQDSTNKFDVVITDLFESEVYAGLSVLYDCPFIYSYSMGAHWQVLRLIDEATNPAYSTDYLSTNIPPLNFWQRLEELKAQIKWTFYKRGTELYHCFDFGAIEDVDTETYRRSSNEIVEYACSRIICNKNNRLMTKPIEEKLYVDIFEPLLSKRGRKLPPYEDIIYNASLIFGNDHHSFGNMPKLPLNFKLIGGQHVSEHTTPLPEDLQKLMDGAKHGVIYFSMGSTWKSKDMPQSLTDALLKMFGELQQTVIWKYEIDLKKVPPNVHIVHWAPQPGILAHPNCLMFISHGGQLSSTEAVHFGVPVIGVPIYCDQFLNINKAVAHGYAVRVELSYDLPSQLKSAIKTVLSDNSYSWKAKELSAIYHHRPVSPGAELVHWVEHVVRTRGAPHLRSPVLLVPWYQKLYLDLVAILILTSLMIISSVKSLLMLLMPQKNKTSPKRKRH